MQEKNMGHICPIGRSGVNSVLIHGSLFQEHVSLEGMSVFKRPSMIFFKYSIIIIYTSGVC